MINCFTENPSNVIEHCSCFRKWPFISFSINADRLSVPYYRRENIYCSPAILFAVVAIDWLVSPLIVCKLCGVAWVGFGFESLGCSEWFSVSDPPALTGWSGHPGLVWVITFNRCFLSKATYCRPEPPWGCVSCLRAQWWIRIVISIIAQQSQITADAFNMPWSDSKALFHRINLRPSIYTFFIQGYTTIQG